MNSESDNHNMREEDIEDVLANVTENDVDFRGEAPVISVEKLRNGEPVFNFRRNSLRRSLSSLRSKFYGRSTSSMTIERNKDDLWDGMENQAMNRSEEDVTREKKTNGNVSFHYKNENQQIVQNGDDLNGSHMNVNDSHKTVISIGK